VLNEFHLFALVQEYVNYYNNDRCHYALDKETPAGRPVQHKESDDDTLVALPKIKRSADCTTNTSGIRPRKRGPPIKSKIISADEPGTRVITSPLFLQMP